jgi:hypothetical protein
MKKSEIDHLIANLGVALITNRESFESLAKQQTGNLSIDDLPYLLDKLHNSPPVHPDIKKEELQLGEWMAICQYAIFELIYQFDIKALPTLKAIAFGEYDWTQATALEVLCRLYADGKLAADIISEIDLRLNGMRHETYLYFTRSLLKRREHDQRFAEIITQIKDIDFRCTLAELGHNLPMTRNELIELGKKIIAANASEREVSSLMELFDVNVPHPEGSNLFYYPENYNADTDDITQYNPSVEEVVDKCLSYKGI